MADKDDINKAESVTNPNPANYTNSPEIRDTIRKDIIQFENMITGFSSILVDTPEEKLENELNDWLKRFVEFLDVDRCVIIEYKDNRKTIHTVMNYIVPEVDSVDILYDYQPFTGVIEELEKGVVIRAEKVPDDLPPNFRGGLIEKDKTKSVIIVPLSIGNKVIGSLLFSSYRKECSWPDNIVSPVKLIGEIIASTILRIRSHKALLEEMERRHKTEETYSTILKNAHVGFMITDFSDLCIIDVNDEYCSMSGFSREELISKKIWELDVSLDPEKVKLDRDSLGAQNGNSPLQTSHIRKDGSKFDVEVSGNLFKEEGIFCTFIRDVTDFKKAKKELEERLEFEELVTAFSSTLINIKPGDIGEELNLLIKKIVEFFKVDRGIIGEYMRKPSSIKILMSYTASEFMMTPLEDSYTISESLMEEYEKGLTIKAEKINEDLPAEITEWALSENIKSVVIIPLASEKQVIGNITLASHSQESVWSDDLVRRIKLIGEIIANAIIRMRSHKSLIKEVERRELLEQKYSSILKNASVGFWITNFKDASIIDVNDEYCRMSGYSREELLSKKIWEIDAFLDPGKVAKEGRNLDATGASHHVTQHIRKDGTLFDLDVSSNLYEKDGIVCSFMRNITDLNTARKELEERLEFEGLISEFSAALISPDDYHTELNLWIKKFVEFLKVDRGVINEHQVDTKTVKVLMQYTVPEVENPPLDDIYGIPEGEIEEFEKGMFLCAEKIPEDLPDLLRGGMIERDNTRSVIIVPLMAGNKAVGSLTFATYRKERKWSHDIVRRIKLIGEIMASAILRKRSRDALLKEIKRRKMLEDKYSSILKNASVGFWITDFSDLSIIDVNDEYCRMTGYSREEILSKKIWELDASGDPEKIIRERSSMMDQNGIIHLETRHVRKDGTKIDVLVSANTFPEEGIVCNFIRDVSELKAAQKDLEERLKFEELVSEFSNSMINIQPEDINNALDIWLRRFVEFLNADRGIINEHLYEENTVHLLHNYTVPGVEIPLTDFHKIPDKIGVFFRKGIDVKAEKIPDDLPEGLKGGLLEKEKAKSALIVPLFAINEVIGNLTLINYRNARKWPADLVKRIKLIGEIIANAILRIRSHEELIDEMEQRRLLEERYTSFIKNADLGFMVSDMNSKILDVNDAYCEMSGYSRDELIGMGIEKIDPSLLDQNHLHTDKLKILKNEGLSIETNHRRKDGTIIDVALNSNYLENEGIIFNFIRDITESNQAKKEQTERLRFEELVSEFSAVLINIKHEKITDELEKWIIKLVDFLEIGRGVINEYDYDNNTMNALVSYTSPVSAVVTSPHDKVLKTPCEVMNEFKKGAMIRAEKIPEDLKAPFQGWIIEKHNTKSLVVVPLISESQVIGNLTLAGYNKERKWPDDIFNRIKLIGEIIANAILRMRAHEALNKAQEELKERLEFEEVISEFSTALINIRPDDIKDELEKWLEKFVELIDADRAGVNEYIDDQQTIKNLIQYSIPGINAHIPHRRKTPEGEIFELEKGIIRAEKMPHDLPESFIGSYIERSNARSLIIVPLLTGNRIFGNLAFSNYRKERKWSDELIRRIKLIGEIVGNAILRLRSHEALINEMERRHILEERYSSIIRSANLGFMISDLNANILEVNNAYCEMSGYSRDELLRMKIYQLDTSGDKDKVDKDKDGIFETGSFHHEARHKRKDGKIIDLLISANLLEKEGLIFSFYRDVTELKVARKDLEERLKFEELTAEFSAALINIKLENTNEDLAPWLEKYVEFFGVERGIINEYDYDQGYVNAIASYTDPGVDVPPTEISSRAPEPIMKKLSKGPIIRAEKIPEELPSIFNEGIIRRHNTKSILIVPLLAENQVIGNLTFTTYTKEHKWSDEFLRRVRLIGEITANAILRKRSSDALLEEMKSRHMLEEKYTSIIKNASVGFTISDREQNILDVNDEYCRMSGYSHEELTKMKISDIDISESTEKVAHDIALTIDGGLYHHQSSHIRKDGTIFDVDVHSQYSESEGFFFSFVRDVTELNKARRDLEERLKFEELVSEFSAALINIEPGKIKNEIANWIVKIVDILDVDMGIVNEYINDQKNVMAFLHYTVPGLSLPVNKIRETQPGFISLLEKGVMKAEKIPEDLPLPLRGGLVEEHDTKSLIVAPLLTGNRVFGNLTFACYKKERKWSDDLVRRIKLIGEIIANAILRKHSSDALLTEMERRRRLEERYTSIIKNANVGFMISDLNQNIMVVNDEYCRMSGYSRDELTKMRISDIDHSDDQDKIEKDAVETIEAGSYHHQTRHVHRSGKIYDVEVNSKFLESERIVFSFIRDVTDLNKAKRELEERLKFEELISEFSAALINVKIANIKEELNLWLERFAHFLNVDKYVLGEFEENYSLYRYIATYINPELEPQPQPFPSEPIRPYGFTRYLIKGETIVLENLEQAKSRFPETLTQKLQDDGTKSIIIFPLVAGDLLLGSMIISSMSEERTWPLHLVRELKLVAEIFANALMRDKRDLELDNYRKDLEKMVDKRTAELKETQKELVLSEKMATLGRLTATVSHELRNPLGTIRSSVFSVQKRYKGQDDKLVTALDRAERNIKRCDLIIDELLNYSRVQDLKLEPTSIDEWLSEVLEETIPPAGISIKKELESKSVINMDQERFRRSIVNILTNAYQAIEEKGGNEPGYVHAFTYKEGENLIIEIADNGVGFDMKNKNRIFEPLYSTKTFGVGLGVSITKQIIEQHGWFMDISGEPKKGATVIITIPLDKNIKSYFGGH